MSTTKTHFKPGKSNLLGGSKTSAGSGSKRVNNPAASGFIGGGGQGTKEKATRVFFQGKDVTPQSLIPRHKTAYVENKPKAQQVPSLGTQVEEDLTEKLVDRNIGSLKKVPSKPHEDELNVSRHGHSHSKKDHRDNSSAFAVVHLNETMTETVLFLPSLIVSTDIRDLNVVEEKNSKYVQLVESHKNADGYTPRATQTVNNAQKNQNEMAAPNALKEFGCQASSFDIVDTVGGGLRGKDDAADYMSASTETDATSVFDKAGLSNHVKTFVTDTVSVSLAAPGCLLDPTLIVKQEKEAKKKTNNSNTEKQAGGQAGSSSAVVNSGSKVAVVAGTGLQGGSSGQGIVSGIATGATALAGGGSGWGVDLSSQIPRDSSTGGGSGLDIDVSNSNNGNNQRVEVTDFTEQDILQVLRAREAERIMSSKLLLKRMLMLERAVQQNVYHRQHLDYRDLPDVEPLVLLDEEDRSRLQGGGAAVGR